MGPGVFEVDRYELHEPIASGGMATVYFARQRGAAGFAKAVAVKRMRPELLGDPDVAALFLDEARLAARLRHVNVVSIIDVVSTGSELSLVMEYLHGESLARLLAAAGERGERVPLDVVVAIAVGILHGLHAAHEATGDDAAPLGIVHRDVSPQNVIVGADGIARVVDFGIARAAGQIHETAQGKTRGKVRYSAPEQLRGRPVDRRADLFATSALVWEMLVGRPLFEGDAPDEVMKAVLSEPILPPSRFVPDLPIALDEAVMRGLERDPKRRPSTAEELARALERALSPASATTVGQWVRSLAKETLDERAAMLRRIESAPSTIAAAEAAAPRASDVVTEEIATRRMPPRSSPANKRGAVIAVAAVALAAALLVMFGLGARSPARVPGAPPPAKTASLEPEPPAPVVFPPVDPPPAPAGSEQPAIATAKPPSPLRDRNRPPPPAPVPPRAKKGCDPPYDLDSSGRKIFRVDCL